MGLLAEGGVTDMGWDYLYKVELLVQGGVTGTEGLLVQVELLTEGLLVHGGFSGRRLCYWYKVISLVHNGITDTRWS